MSERNGNGHLPESGAAVQDRVNGEVPAVRPDLTDAQRAEAIVEWDRRFAEVLVEVRANYDRQAEEAKLESQPERVQVGVNRLRELVVPPKKEFRLFSAAQLNSGQYETRYLVRGILAAGQPGGIFGAFKTLKTSLAADLLISIASGTPFLGRFPVPQPGRVLFLSGESGLPALQSIARRICAERGLSLEKLDNFVLSPDLPRLDLKSDVAALKKLIEAERPVCVVIDPAYLTLGGDTGRNLFAMGSLLRPLAELCESTGCTVLVVHHCKRSQKAGDPATLDDIAWSGFAEFSAQWLLVSRRRPFDPATGHHELWLARAAASATTACGNSTSTKAGRTNFRSMFGLTVRSTFLFPANTASGRRFCVQSPRCSGSSTSSSSRPARIAVSAAGPPRSTAKSNACSNFCRPTPTAATPPKSAKCSASTATA